MLDRFKLNLHERRILFLSSLGGALELYDFIIFGLFSIYFSSQFFPASNALVSIIETYSVFAIGYIARPLGGIIFSHIGDEYGRKNVLITTTALMGGASLLIGLLPTYHQVGVIAPILLLLLRLIQGIALGGELPSTYVYISESLANKRGYAFGIVMVWVNSGVLIGSIINDILMHLFNHQQLLKFGWRIPFLFGGLIGVLSYKIRRALHETQAFSNIFDKAKIPVWYLLTRYPQKLFLAIGLLAILASLSMVGMLFMPSYLHLIMHVKSQHIDNILLILMPFNLISIFVTGILADRVPITRLIAILVVASIVLVPVSYYLLSMHSYYLLGLIILAILEGSSAATIPLVLTILFPTKVRLSGVTLSYNFGFTIFSGLAPFVITQLILFGYNIYIVPIVYILLATAISGLSLYYVYKNSHIITVK